MNHVPPTHYEVLDSSHRTTGILDHSPFTVGRLPDRDLILEDVHVSRRHAEISYEDGAFHVTDTESRHGTFVNGVRVQRQRLSPEDTVHFGSLEGPKLRFGIADASSTSTIRELLVQLPAAVSSQTTGLEKLRWFLEAARRLNAVGAVDQILSCLVETTLDLTKVERGYFFLCDENGKPRFAAGRNNKGESLTDDSTLSRSAIQQAISSASEFIVTDTLKAEAVLRSESMIMQNIRSIICIPLRSRRKQAPLERANGKNDLLGVLYLDSRLHAGNLTQVDSEMLRSIASEAAALIDNAQLVIAEEQARRYREELDIAAKIQQGLMAVQIPDLPHAKVSARSVPCKEIGGDFYDVIVEGDHIYLVIVDVSGKGIPAALLASTLQGLIYSQLKAGHSLEMVATLVNQYICAKNVGRYATLCILKLSKTGQLDYINCGHPRPIICTGQHVQPLQASNLPVGLIDDASFSAGTSALVPGTRVFLVTDGVTEAENAEGAFFGDTRLQHAVGSSCNLDGVALALQSFCEATPATDDCTMLELLFL
ncbi:SpoIIE family protein phosphatase [Alloacidobacterium dinghuense]|uniref:SpoIIE family protein phosphatase n=1 Tax=Alloacidobacterium dinghuense TaxID=2763107 RepID=A0A7G8BPJ7_9BACT|nr:SpoIIE family protein phosphatase [Alloacidobacterium dinghuense]QNI34467.1 SpoIIE family protein phosphatase [Alloacidobacterium dinghuense]